MPLSRTPFHDTTLPLSPVSSLVFLPCRGLLYTCLPPLHTSISFPSLCRWCVDNDAHRLPYFISLLFDALVEARLAFEVYWWHNLSDLFRNPANLPINVSSRGCGMWLCLRHTNVCVCKNLYISDRCYVEKRTRTMTECAGTHIHQTCRRCRRVAVFVYCGFMVSSMTVQIDGQTRK